MKKTIFYLALAILATSCVKENAPVTNESEVELLPMEFVTSVEDTKTYLDEDGQSVLWIKGDKVAVFDGTSEKKTFEAQESGAEVTLKGEAATADEYYATYPVYGTMTDGVFTATVSAQQNAKMGSMSNNCAVVVAKAEGDKFHFKNVSSLIKFNLAVEGVKSLTLMGNNNEQIAGKFTFTWNNGDPQITGITVPQVAVSVRNSNGNDLAVGDYYFTIIPTNFEKGFSVILGMNDGTQKIVTRSASLTLAKNQIFRTQDVPEGAYKAYSSDFVKYHAGADLVYGGVTINKQTYGDPTYVYENETVISKDGLYFISPDATGVKMDYAQIGKLVIIGEDSQNRSSVHFNMEMQPKNGADNYFICANLNMTKTKNSNDSYINTTSGLTEAYGLMLLNNCKIGDIGTAFARCLSKPFTLERFIMQDCDYIVRGDTGNSYIIYGNGVTLTLNDVVFKNNVFHNVKKQTGSSTTDFKLIHGYRTASAAGLTVKNLTVVNNTLSYVLTKNTGFVYVANMTGLCTVTNNFYVECHAPATITPIINSVTSYADTFEPNITSNLFYAAGATKGLNVSSVPANGGTKNSPGLLTFNPLSDNWAPENGVFGYKENLQYYKTFNTPGTEIPVSSTTNGAQRKTSDAVLNRAGYGYASEEFGTL